MKFLLRSFVVLAIAVAVGVVLYYAVQALPSDSLTSNPSANQLPAENGKNAPKNLPPRPTENNRGGGIRWRSVLGIARRTIIFTVIVFVGVIAKNFLFERKPNKKKMAD